MERFSCTDGHRPPADMELKEETGELSPLPRHSPLWQLVAALTPASHLASAEHSSSLRAWPGAAQVCPRSGAGNNAALCGFWPWRSLIKALAFLGTVGRETWPAQPPVPFTRCLGLLLGAQECEWLLAGVRSSTHPISSGSTASREKNQEV